MSPSDKALIRAKFTVAEAYARQSRYSHIRQLYLEELIGSNLHVKAGIVTPEEFHAVKKSVRKKLRSEALLKFTYVIASTAVMAGVLVLALAFIVSIVKAGVVLHD